MLFYIVKHEKWINQDALAFWIKSMKLVSPIGRQVDVIYDPSDLEELTIEYEGYSPCRAKKLVIGERAGKLPTLPPQLQVQEANSSRLLKAAEQKHQERQIEQTPAIAFRAVWKEEEDNV